MHARHGESKWWRRFLPAAPDDHREAVDILCQRYLEEIEGAARFKNHAQEMHYPQFREKLLQFSLNKTTHAGLLAEKISALSAKPPDVPNVRSSTDQNDWRNLLTDLEEENRVADDLPRQLWSIESSHPDVAELLTRINEKEKEYRPQIRGMMMRSDAFALSLA